MSRAASARVLTRTMIPMILLALVVAVKVFKKTTPNGEQLATVPIRATNSDLL